MVELQELHKENWIPFAKMELPASQSHLVASNAMTIAESKFHPEQSVFGIYSKKEPVGLIAFCYDNELQQNDCWIYRFMISPKHQGKGLGKRAFELTVLKIISSGAKRILTMCKPTNTVAYHLYLEAGFSKAGILDDGDTLLEKNIDKIKPFRPDIHKS